MGQLDELVNNFILKGVTNPSLVPEFQKHAKLIPDIAKDLDKSFSDSGPAIISPANTSAASRSTYVWLWRWCETGYSWWYLMESSQAASTARSEGRAG